MADARSRSTLAPPRIRLDHVGVHVSELERSVRFYGEVLGLREAARLRFGAEAIVFMADGDDGFVELICDGSPRRATGVVDHLALRVDDVAAALQRLRGLGVELLDQAPLSVAEIGGRIAFCLGPDGERIELIERP